MREVDRVDHVLHGQRQDQSEGGQEDSESVTHGWFPSHGPVTVDRLDGRLAAAAPPDDAPAPPLTRTGEGRTSALPVKVRRSPGVADDWHDAGVTSNDQPRHRDRGLQPLRGDLRAADHRSRATG